MVAFTPTTNLCGVKPVASCTESLREANRWRLRHPPATPKKERRLCRLFQFNLVSERYSDKRTFVSFEKGLEDCGTTHRHSAKSTLQTFAFPIRGYEDRDNLDPSTVTDSNLRAMSITASRSERRRYDAGSILDDSIEVGVFLETAAANVVEDKDR
ncbi:uncharacterized protein LOC123988437 isoform X1 [Osmia bicornis bicornis]|uniref:uncharacterized protein LOC123988380 n=1 Tax=Osmia bicornis bicornis TaxID=1437191 RepID=UPI001EAF750F|nr:uncharacterized protein LOC123988007 isoform X1 [Osmia bicornis bicornis]XP_046142557.1 uncharacterized protein LOC123988007 isoform X1 [Osmia bicornis bicornis]XP_046144207.1 uncharacterized protein LOC123988380 [Osmia bicornis bicornis]XP_046144211.1 uncharacterized protein LOC123988380 [Osmia bicornis bicornis]XP_046144212.1 uncharacterized protein LOC123988380 [Osmia bicornis bicornis]XP_046144466.1 uncharacterized protein LOC123988437 isoform X1 [Osmia bicornis bicornis]XP_046144467.1